MAFKIIWSADALDDYMKILDYLSLEWGDIVVSNFIDKLDKRIIAISLNPNIGKVSEQHQSVRSIVITPHNKLYYQSDKESVEIVNIFDTRRNPSKNRFE